MGTHGVIRRQFYFFDAPVRLEEVSQLLGRLSPVFQGHGPLFTDIAVSQTNQFLQCRVIRENPFVFCHLANLAMISLHRVGGVDQSPDGISI